VFDYCPEEMFSRPASLGGSLIGRVEGSPIPPRLAAQSAFPSGPLPGFSKKYDQGMGDDPKILTAFKESGG
jgi:hypothetical protein